MKISKLLTTVFSAAILATSLTTGLSATQLLPHRAVYDLKLKDASSRSGISGLVGRIVYEFRGSKCDGYTVNFRFVSQIFTGESSRVSDQQTSTYENSEDNTFQFLSRSFVNQKLDRETRGLAENIDGELLVDLKKPEAKELQFPVSAFPTGHLIELIEKAKAGETVYESRIFDGSDGGDQSLITTSIIGNLEETSSTDNEEVKIIGDTGTAAVWPVSLSYFEEAKSGDVLPIYRIAFKLYEDGVSRELTMDYGDFVIEGKISGFELLEKEAACK
jgi:hypothetical protein